MELDDVIQLLNAKPPSVKEVSKADAFRNALFTYIREERCAVLSKPPVEDGLLRCSQVAKLLDRLPQLRLLKSFPEIVPAFAPNTLGEQLNFDVGHAIHKWWQDVYVANLSEDSGFRLWGDWLCLTCSTIHRASFIPSSCRCGTPRPVYSEMEVIDGKLRLKGHPDGLLVELPVMERLIMEIKTIGSSNWDQLKGPVPEHRVQVHCYQHATDCKGAIYIYVDKGKQSLWRYVGDGNYKTVGEPRVKVFYEDFDQALWSRIEAGVTEFWSIYDRLAAARVA